EDGPRLAVPRDVPDRRRVIPAAGIEETRRRRVEPEREHAVRQAFRLGAVIEAVGERIARGPRRREAERLQQRRERVPRLRPEGLRRLDAAGDGTASGHGGTEDAGTQGRKIGGKRGSREDREAGGVRSFLKVSLPLPFSPPAVASRFKIFSDPVHGFISVPKRLLLDLIETPEFQRLRRIRQLGLGHLVFPGAEHTRFQHALGAMALMQRVLANLAEKGTPISDAEHEAALATALLHDVGHGPFSHTLESDLVGPVASGPFRHERMSRVLIERLNERLGGALGLTLAIFDGAYERPFFERLLSSQLDMDRLDYLRRDSFYTGVAEGVVGVDRILKTMRVHPLQGGPDADVVIEAKGAYAVESYLLSRRLMYWQVYLHKTVLAADHLLRAAFHRARRCCTSGDPAVRSSSPALFFFLDRRVTAGQIAEPAVLDAFCALDDTDVLFSLKRWTASPDPILADLARRFTDRDLFR